jgi:hypothetical protein
MRGGLIAALGHPHVTAVAYAVPNLVENVDAVLEPVRVASGDLFRNPGHTVGTAGNGQQLLVLPAA